MIIYDDRCAELSIEQASKNLRACWESYQQEGSAQSLLIQTGEFTQAILDQRFLMRGYDELETCEKVCSELCLAASELYIHGSSNKQFLDLLDSIYRLAQVKRITVKAVEGYAFYALDPHQYVIAAHELRIYPQPVRVVGIRSIGTSLSALLSVALNSRLAPITVRPISHPFHRTIRIGKTLKKEILAEADHTIFAIVDDGPGLSGSSFGALIDWLTRHGIRLGQIHAFPAHPNSPGYQASKRHLHQWRGIAKHVAPTESAALGEDISGGKWRHYFWKDEVDFPPIDLMKERKKYLSRHLHNSHQPRFHKFLGFGHYGDQKYLGHKVLEQAGWVPPVLEFHNGFMTQQWMTEARPLRTGTEIDRQFLIKSFALYISTLTNKFPEQSLGASPDKLFEMLAFNSGQALEQQLVAEFKRWREHLPQFASQLRPTRTDNKWHCWEWLLLPSGRLLKTDAMDHFYAHDLIGCQDPHWDIAAASVEFSMTEEEEDLLLSSVSRAVEAFRGNRLLLTFYQQCYLAFQLGAFSLALASTEAAEEKIRLQRSIDGYVHRLSTMIKRPIWTG